MSRTSYQFKRQIASLLLTTLLLVGCNNIKKPIGNAVKPIDNQLSTHKKGYKLENQQTVNANPIAFIKCRGHLQNTLINNYRAYSKICTPSAFTSKEAQLLKIKKRNLSNTKQYISEARKYKITQLVNKPLNWVSYEGHLLHKIYYSLRGELYGIVYDKGDPNLIQKLPLYIMPEVSIQDLVQCDMDTLHITLNRLAIQGRILIGKAGIIGGGRNKGKKKKSLPNVVTKQRNAASKESTVKPGLYSTKGIVLPHPSNLPTVSVKCIFKNNKDKQEFKNALIAMQSPNFYSNKQTLNKVLDAFMHVASCGNTLAMFHIGEICEHQNNIDLAIRWYVLSFQNGWFQDTAKAYDSHAYRKLQALIGQGHQVYERLFIYHPVDIISATGKLLRLRQLIHFYKSGVVEPYLNKEEVEPKIKQLEAFNNSLNLVVKESEEEFKISTAMKKMFIRGNMHEELGEYKEAAEYYLQCQEVPAALLSLGWFHYRGYLNFSGDEPNKKINYQLAAAYYEKARMPESYYNLGFMYLKGLVGEINEEPNYLEAIKCFELAGTTKSFTTLAAIFSGVYGQQPDYEKAQDYLKRCDTGEAYCQLASLCLLGHIEKETLTPNYKLIAFYCTKAIEKGSIEAALILAALYMGGYIGKLAGKNNYQLAAKYFRDVINCINTPNDKKAICLYCIGLIYKEIDIDSKHQKPDYQKAKYYLKQAALPESFYVLATLYEDGHINTQKKNRQGNNYKKALKYYIKSTSVEAKLEIIRLYQQKLIRTVSKLEQEEAIKSTLQEVDNSISMLSNSPLSVLSKSKGNIYYLKGLRAYYLKDFVEASIFFQQALFYGTDEENIEELINETERYLEQMYEYMVGAVAKEEATGEAKISQSTTLEVIEEKEEESSTSISSVLTTPIQNTLEKEVQESSVSLTPVTTSIYQVPKQQNKYLQQYIGSTKRKRKEEKKARRLTHIKANILENSAQQSITTKEHTMPTKLNFLDEKQEQEFLTFKEKKENKKNLEKILEDIQYHNWAAVGIGKPEVLKHLYKGYRGCISRHLNYKDRFVYKVIGKREILILSWKGHYDHK
jgi:TPR repeat protein/Txe/YoeB family toxin of Txe-Axe toxin-antitoxin module